MIKCSSVQDGWLLRNDDFLSKNVNFPLTSGDFVTKRRWRRCWEAFPAVRRVRAHAHPTGVPEPVGQRLDAPRLPPSLRQHAGGGGQRGRCDHCLPRDERSRRGHIDRHDCGQRTGRPRLRRLRRYRLRWAFHRCVAEVKNGRRRRQHVENH